MADWSNPLGALEELDKRLTERQTALQLFEDYYEGRQRLAFASTKFRNAFGSLFNSFADNWCQLIVDSSEERLNIDGFRMGAAGEGADQDAWRIWQANSLDLDSQLAHTDALVHGSAYVTVWAGEDPTIPSITVESARQCIVAYAPGSRRTRIAALKKWLDDDEYQYATLYLRDAIWKFRSQNKSTGLGGGQRTQWIARPGEEAPVPNPLGVVPVVELKNLPRVLGPGRSEIEQIIPLQDATNKLVMDMLVAAEFSAFKQRWVTGLEIPTDENGNPIEPFKAAVDRLWISENPDTKFGEFQQTDLGGYVRAIETMVQHAATLSRTPPHYFLLNGGQAPSGEAITSAEAGLVAKVQRKMRSFSEGWEEVMRLAFAVLGDQERATAYDAEVIWANPAYRSESALVDALLKLSTLGVPKEQLWADAGYTPQQIERFKVSSDVSALMASLDPTMNASIPQAEFAPPDEV
jgi:hypothetical protein